MFFWSISLAADTECSELDILNDEKVTTGGTTKAREEVCRIEAINSNNAPVQREDSDDALMVSCSKTTLSLWQDILIVMVDLKSLFVPTAVMA